MSKQRVLLSLLLMALLQIAGCGYRGALYLPDEAQDNRSEQSSVTTVVDPQGE